MVVVRIGVCRIVLSESRILETEGRKMGRVERVESMYAFDCLNRDLEIFRIGGLF